MPFTAPVATSTASVAYAAARAALSRDTDAQRGDGAFEKSITALRLLNAAGYGEGNPKRILSLMTNPAGAFLDALVAAPAK